MRSLRLSFKSSFGANLLPPILGILGGPIFDCFSTSSKKNVSSAIKDWAVAPAGLVREFSRLVICDLWFLLLLLGPIIVGSKQYEMILFI